MAEELLVVSLCDGCGGNGERNSAAWLNRSDKLFGMFAIKMRENGQQRL